MGDVSFLKRETIRFLNRFLRVYLSTKLSSSIDILIFYVYLTYFVKTDKDIKIFKYI
jgi:hypothetical protein